MPSALHAVARPFLRTALAYAPLPGVAPRNDRGHALDRAVRIIVGAQSERREPAAALGVGRMRESFERDVPLADFSPRPMHRVAERWIASADPSTTMRARIYEPAPARGRRPACVYFHGGGFVIGSLDSHDGICRYLAEQTGAVVVSVDYRLAPEHRFPAAALDAVAAFRWVARNARELGIDPSRIAVAGDSAGGNLSAIASLELRGDEVRPCFQLLVYPATDMTRSLRSHRLFGSGFLLESATLDWFLERYLTSDAEQRHPLASPLLRGDLAGAPPAYVVPAGFDPLRDEGEAYGQALEAAGVPVELHTEEPLVHGFFSMGGISATSHAAIARAANALARSLWGTSRRSS